MTDAAVGRPKSALRSRDFRIVWSSLTVSFVGSAFTSVAFPLLVYETSRSVATMGRVNALGQAVAILAVLASGPLVDRTDPRRVMIGSTTLQMLIAITLCLQWTIRGPAIFLLYACSVVEGLALGPFTIAQQRLLKNLVPTAELMGANQRIEIAFAASLVLGQLTAGVFCERFGPPLAIGFDGVTFAISALAIWALRTRPPAVADGEASSGFGAGVKFLLGDRLLRSGSAIMSCLGFIDAAAPVLFVFRLRHDLDAGDRGIGLVLAFASAGGVLGLALVPSARRRIGVGPTMVGCLTLVAIAFLGGSIATSLAANAAAAALYACGRFGATMAWSTVRQIITPQHLLGRVTSIAWGVTQTMRPLGALATTHLAERFDTGSTFRSMAALACVVAVGAALGPIGRERTADRGGA